MCFINYIFVSSSATFDNFARQRLVGFGAARNGIVNNRGQSVARCFAEPYVSGNNGLENRLRKMLMHLGGHLM